MEGPDIPPEAQHNVQSSIVVTKKMTRLVSLKCLVPTENRENNMQVSVKTFAIKFQVE